MKITAITILNWNGLAFLQQFLPTVIARSQATLPGHRAEVVIADNGSTDGSADWVQSHFPQVRLLRFDRNYGFTGGYNRAFREIAADYYVLLNSDVEVGEGWLDPLLAFMEQSPAVGICVPKVLSYHRRDHFEYAGAAGGYVDALGYPFCRGRILTSIEQDRGQYDRPAPVFWAGGVCLLIRSGLWHQLGGLDEAFFAHMEEIDLCWRAQLSGHRVYALPQSCVWHVGGGTLPNNSPRKLLLNYRNNLCMLYKNLAPARRGPVIFLRRLLDLLSAAVYLLQGQKDFARSVLQAHKEYRRMRPALAVTRDRSGARDLRGLYPYSIVLRFFLDGKQTVFSQLTHFK